MAKQCLIKKFVKPIFSAVVCARLDLMQHESVKAVVYLPNNWRERFLLPAAPDLELASASPSSFIWLCKRQRGRA